MPADWYTCGGRMKQKPILCWRCNCSDAVTYSLPQNSNDGAWRSCTARLALLRYPIYV